METEGIILQLARLQELRLEVAACMTALDMATTCTQCSKACATGGCCSSFMADENDAVQLLINLLVRIELTENRQQDLECVFLGAKGCELDYKPFFCLNYLCHRIRANSSPVLLKDLETATGRLLQGQLAMEAVVLSFLKQQGCLD